ncbi:MAG: excinuclease ABC subunit UvrC [Oscillospiraceae bacterium]|nr:excinuclease ABC subunit UvrC [Oscillospiraceae bacterium]
MTRSELRQMANDLPLAPGVYLMMDKSGKVIYVGKAKKLKNRVSQYFQDSASHNEKTRAMVSQVDHFDTIFVRSEFEALVLENSLIKHHQPRYNILLKDDKGYPFVRLPRDVPYPRLTLVGKAADDGARYFGPFGARQETRAAIDAVCAALKIPTCRRQFPRDIGKERPCLNYHIGKCDGFCRKDGPGEAVYRERMEQACRLLSGKMRQLSEELTEQMERAAEDLQFETAAQLRDRVRALELLRKQQQVIAGVCADTDVWGVYAGQVRCGCAVLHIENGNVLGREVQVFPAAADEGEAEILSAVLSQYYLSRTVLPRELVLPSLWEGADTFAAVLGEQAGHRVTLRCPKRGERNALVIMAQRNAREEAERATSESERISKTLEDLASLAGLSAPPRRLESYDISNLRSDDMVASMVVFQDGRPLKRDYRRFQIKTLSAPDDYAAMGEVLDRRLRHYLDGDEKFTPLPDLMLIDGGENHARAAQNAVTALGLDIPILGMVKDDRHRTRALVTVAGQELGIRNNPPLFALIGRIQEEVHRFAITYHRQKHTRGIYRSKLDGIPGLGQARKKALLKAFGTVTAVTQATVAELAAVIPKNTAQAVYEKFHPHAKA